MERNITEGKISMDDQTVEEEEQNEGLGDDNINSNKRKRDTITSSGNKVQAYIATPSSGCQGDNCTSDMRNSKVYYRRHKVCEFHSKAPAVLVAGLQKRFCQQCSRFHELSEFDETKRSCRNRLAGHNERRRKSSYDSLSQGEGPS